MRIKIDGEIYEVTVSWAAQGRYQRYPHAIIRQGRMEFYLFPDSESAGAAVADYYKDLRANDPAGFRALIGDEQLIQWSCGESDSFGISSFSEFLEVVAQVPEEHWASYDGHERTVERVGRLIDEIGFTPTVAYRCN